MLSERTQQVHSFPAFAGLVWDDMSRSAAWRDRMVPDGRPEKETT